MCLHTLHIAWNVESIYASFDPDRSRGTYLSKGAKYLVPIVSADSYPEAALTTLVYVYGFRFDDRVCTHIALVHTPAHLRTNSVRVLVRVRHLQKKKPVTRIWYPRIGWWIQRGFVTVGVDTNLCSRG